MYSKIIVVYPLLFFLSSEILLVTSFIVPSKYSSIPKSESSSDVMSLLSSSEGPSTTTGSLHDLETIRGLTQTAIVERGTTIGLQALDTIGTLCQERQSYRFENANSNSSSKETVVTRIPQLIPRLDDTYKKIWQLVERIARKGWMSTNPDSVDGLPSFHLNLIVGGRPVYDDKQKSSLSDYEQSVSKMAELVMPYLRETLLPIVRERLDDDGIEIDEVFLRRYGDEIDPEQQEGRRGISAHYDVFSRVTSVVALDDAAASGRNGLYTTTTQNSKFDTQEAVATNHAALRSYFPLDCGDAIVHTWDVLHGVNVETGVDRTSLIVWFTTATTDEENTKDSDNDSCTTSWLYNQHRIETDDINQFVLASALESGGDSPIAVDKLDLYLSSAKGGNSFAYTRVGNACTEGELSSSQMEKAKDIVGEMAISLDNETTAWLSSSDMKTEISRQCWLAGAIMGNPLSQICLANSIMEEFSKDEDARLLAGVLFALAAQQENIDAFDALSRVVELELSSGNIANQEDFEACLLIQTSQIACRYLQD